MFFIFNVGPAAPRAVNVRRLTVVGGLLAVGSLGYLIVVSSGTSKPVGAALDPVVAPAYVAPYVAPQIVPMATLDATRVSVLKASQAMDDETSRKAPGTLGAMQAHSLNEWLQSHTGVKK